MAELLQENSLTSSIPVDSSGKVLGEEARRIYWSLRLLGVRRVPASRDKTVPIELKLEDLGFYDDIDPAPMRVFRDTMELLYRGWPTPLVGLRSLSGGGFRVWAKLEWYNPYSMSVKDRIGWYMVEQALENGWRGGKVYEATSTNTGMALAAMAAIHGFKVRLYIPRVIQKASDTLLRALGAEVVRTEKPLTVDLLEDVRRDAARDRALHIDQFGNDANFLVHLRYTAKELELQLRTARVSPRGIVGGIGTSGHMAAITFYFKNRVGSTRIYMVQPAKGEVIPGIRRVETGMKWIHWVKPDAVVEVTRREAIEALLAVARRDGILPGLSSGAVAAAFIKLRDRGELE
ncbi:MAG TPA: pyridoxal-phosphate dependent enzyme, partial [Pyrodictium sp.]|nr:pyridoxal-phosphate dependent enzyme [Pyrodictium sp.]